MNRGVSFLLFIAIGFSLANLKADPVSISWTGSTSVVSAECGGCYGFTPSITPSMNGSQADLEVDYYDSASARGAGSDSVINSQFTLSAPGEILLSLSVVDSIYGNTCNPGNCDDPYPTWELDAGFTGNATISGPGGLVVPFQQSTSIISDDCGQGLCQASLLLNDSESGMAVLPAGTYTLSIAYSDSNSASGESWEESTVHASLSDPPSPIPEPSYVVWIGLIPLVFLLGRRFLDDRPRFEAFLRMGRRADRRAQFRHSCVTVMGFAGSSRF
jgi:hypothetical protein